MISIPVKFTLKIARLPFTVVLTFQKQNSQRKSSSRSIEMNGDGGKVSPERVVKHPLQDQWTLWYLENDRTKTWEDMQNKVTTFNTVEDFWSLHSHILEPSTLGDLNDYSLFKGNIRPMWEDRANKYGGRWVLTISKQSRRSDVDDMWLDTVSDLFRIRKRRPCLVER